MKRKLSNVRFVRTLPFGTQRAMVLTAGSHIKLYLLGGSLIEVHNKDGVFIVSTTLLEQAQLADDKQA